MGLGDADPFRLFGLPRDASMEEIRRRYHELALAYHPDRRGSDDPQQAKKFAVVREAYEAILQAREADLQNQAYGHCRVCGELKILIPRLDGVMVCVNCIGRSRWVAFLPAPPMVIIKCTFSIACLGAAAVFLVMHFTTGSIPYGLAALGFGTAGLAVVATLGFLFPVTTSRELKRIQKRDGHLTKRDRTAKRT